MSRCNMCGDLLETGVCEECLSLVPDKPTADAVFSWDSMDSAPKDGSQILLWWPYWDSIDPFIGMWDDRSGKWASDRALSDGPGPTHWMNLPTGPK